MAFLAKLFGKKKNNAPAEEVFTEEEGLTPEEEAAAEAAEAALLNGEEISFDWGEVVKSLDPTAPTPY